MAAGKGTRMQGILGEHPKGTISIGKTSIIGHMINVLNDNGVQDILIVGGYKIEDLRKHIGDNATVIYNPLYDHGDDITSLWVAQHYFRDGAFMYLHGDAVFPREFVTRLIQDPRERVMLVERKQCDAEDSKVVIENDRVIRVSKEVDVDEAYGEFVGIAKLSGAAVKSFVESLNEVVEKKGINHFDTMVLQHMIDKGEKVEFLHSDDLPWCDIDFPQDLAHVLDNKELFGL